jgi:hypothetical protein
VSVPGQINHLLIHTLTQQRKAKVPMGKGVFRDELQTIDTVTGRVNPANSKEAMIGEQHKARVTHAIYLQTGAIAKVNDEFLFNGRRFRVTVPMIIPSVDIYTKVLTEEIQGG